MLRSILVGLDGSAHSEIAIEWGLRWAQHFNCLLVGLGVIDEPSVHGSEHEISPSYQQAYTQLVGSEARDVEQCLEKFALRCSQGGVSYKLLEDVGRPEEQILLQSQRYDLILLGRQTHFQAGHHDKTCQTLEKVVRNAVRPVVCVPESPPQENPKGGVLIAYDGSVQAARAVQAFLASGLHALGQVHVLSAHPQSALEAAKTADRAVEFFRFHEITATPIPLVETESPGKCFTQKAEELGVELVVMGAYGQPRLSEFFLGSTTCTALKRSRTPLFLYH